MTNFIKVFVIVKIAFLLTMTASGNQMANKSTNNKDMEEWVSQKFAKGYIPPFSFIYNGVSSDEFIIYWEYKKHEIKSNNSSVKNWIYTYSDPKSGLSVKCVVTLFKDFPAVEWVLKFSNLSEKSTPILESVEVVDFEFLSKTEGKFVLHQANGSNAKRSDFQSEEKIIQLDERVYISPVGGRSSDDTAFPFFNLEMPGDEGIIVAVGWTGNWYASLVRNQKNSVSLKSGMSKMYLALLPKEEIRTPKICLLYWRGEDRMIGHNNFRQFILAHHSPKVDNKPVELPISAFLAREGPSPCNEHTCATESFSKAMINRHKQFDLLPEVFWLDAGWYPCKDNKWYNVGNWFPNSKNFPNGIKPISKSAHNAGARFLLWFEPERVSPGTQMSDLNSEWLLRISDSQDALFNLGNQEARLWLTNYISDFIESEGIDIYRQDFNMRPLPYWEENDTDNRIGISEIKYVEGLYAFWDSLRTRFPELVIDNCASGGRRIDLETISRSSPLWRTDYMYGEPNGAQCHTYNLSFYLPLHGTGCFSISPYHFRSAMSSSMVVNWDINNAEYSQSELQKYFQEFKRLRPYYYEDYYPLTSNKNMTDDNSWLAYQLNRPDHEDGIIMAFRREECEESSIKVALKGIDKNANYKLINEDTQERNLVPGIELINGYTITSDLSPGSLLIWYEKQN